MSRILNLSLYKNTILENTTTWQVLLANTPDAQYYLLDGAQKAIELNDKAEEAKENVMICMYLTGLL